MEQLLPSEIARLVYGYLDDHGCHEAALKFLEQSPLLSECLSLHNDGKKFKTRVDGHSLMNVLDEYCEARNLVSERLQKFPENNVENLRHGGNLLAQLKFLLDASKPGETLLLSITVPPQGSSGQISSSNISSLLSNRPRIRLPSSAERLKRSTGRTQDAKQQQAKYGEDHAVASCSSSVLPIEATPLESLPGLSQIDERSEIDGHYRTGSNVHESSSEQQKDIQCRETSGLHTLSRNCDKGKSTETHRSSFLRSVDNDHFSEEITSTPKRKQTSNGKRKNTPSSKLQTPIGKLQRSLSEDVDSSENLYFSAVYQAFLDNKMPEKIAEITNRVRMPGIGESLESMVNQPSTGNLAAGVTSYEPPPTAAVPIPSVSTCDNELNQVIKTIVEQTEQDPLFERILQDIIPTMTEEMTPSPAEMQSESDEAAPEVVSTEPSGESSPKDTEDEVMPEQTLINTESMGNKASKKEETNASAVVKKTKEFKEHQHPQAEQQEDSDEESKEVPLKQRLRSARQRKSEGSAGEKLACSEPKKSSKKVSPASSSALSSKEKKKETMSLEDQNAAAIQSIVDARIIAQKMPETSNSESQSQKSSPVNDYAVTKASKNANSLKVSQPKLDEKTNQEKEKTEESTSVQQKEICSVIASHSKDASESFKNCASDINNTEDHDVIIFDPSEPFVDSGANFILNSSLVKDQTVHPSVSSAPSQVMTITIPGAASTLQQSPSINNVSVHPSLPSQSAVNSSTSSVVTISIPSSLNSVPQSPVQQVSKQQDQMSMSTVIMCGSDGLVPQFISLPQQDSANSTYVISSSNMGRYIPIAPRGGETTTVLTTLPSTQQQLQMYQATVVQPSVSAAQQAQIIGTADINLLINATAGPSGLSKRAKRRLAAESTKKRAAESTKKISSTSERKTGMRTRSQDKSKLITLYAADDSDRVVQLSSSNIEQPSSTSSALSLPKIIESPQTKPTTTEEDGVTSCLEPGREKLLGALNLKEMQDNSTNNTLEKTKLRTFGRNEKTQGERSNVTKKTNYSEEVTINCPISPHCISLVNLSKNNVLGNNQHKDSPRVPTDNSNKPESKSKVIHKPRETPKPQSRICVNSKRKSLSTPRRQGSHVRSLNFTTPPKTEKSIVRRSNTSPKGLSGKQPLPKTSEKINKSAQRLKTSSAVRSSLFQSPENGNKTVAGRDSTDATSKIPPIATRSPAPQLTGDWDKVTGVGLIFGESSPVSQVPQNDSITEEVTEIRDNVAENDSALIEEQDDAKSSGEQGVESEATERSALGKNNDQLSNESPSKCKTIVRPKFFGTKSSKAWDSDLRALVAADYEDGLLLRNEPKIVRKPRRRIQKSAGSPKSTKSRKCRKSVKKNSKVTEEEARRVEASLNEETCHDKDSDVPDSAPSNTSDIAASDLTICGKNSEVTTIESSDLKSGKNIPKKSISGEIEAEQIGRDKELGEGDNWECVEGKREEREKEQKEDIQKEHTQISEEEEREKIQKELQEEEEGHVEKMNDEHVENMKQDLTNEKKSDQSEEKKKDHADKREVYHGEEMEKEADSTGDVNLKKPTDNKIINNECENVEDLLKAEKKSSQETSGGNEQNKQQNESSEEDNNSIEEIALTDETDDSSSTASTATTSPNTSIASSVNLTTNSKVIQSPTKLKAARRTIVEQSEGGDMEDNLVTYVICTDNEVNADSAVNQTVTSNTDVVSESQEITSAKTQSLRSNKNDEVSLYHSSESVVKDSSITIVSEGVVLRKTKIQIGVCDSTKVSKHSESVTLDTPTKEDGNDPNHWKSDFLCVPMTPRVMSPNPNDTPHTKEVSGSCSFAVSVIETPSFPPTPQIVVTPNDSQEYGQSYSACSSSYYKPSGEHDSSNPDQPLEQVLIAECHKLESHATENTSETAVQTEELNKPEMCDVHKATVSEDQNGNVNENVTNKTKETVELTSHSQSVEGKSSHKEPEDNLSNDKSVHSSGLETVEVNKSEKNVSSVSSLKKPKRAKTNMKKRCSFQIRSKSQKPINRRSKTETRDSPSCSDSEEEVIIKPRIRNSSKKGLHVKTKDEMIQSHLEAARMELFGNQSPSDDYDFASSDHSDTETKQILPKEYPLHKSKLQHMYSDNDTTVIINESNVQLNNSIENAEEKSLSNIIKKTVRFKCDEMIKEHSNLISELEEKRLRTLARLKAPKVTIKQSKRAKSKIEDKSSTILQNKPPDLHTSAPLKENPSPGTQVLDAGEKNKVSDNLESNISTETVKEPVANISQKSKPEISPTKRNSHLSVEAIVDRLTREKTAVAVQHVQVQRHHVQVGEENSCDEFGSLHLTSEDEDSQVGTSELSQVENKLRELHGGKESTVNVQVSPMPLQDVCKALEMTPSDSPSKSVNNEMDVHLKTMEGEQMSICEELNKEKEVDLHETSNASVEEEHDGKRKRRKLADKEESVNKKIKSLLGEDVSPVKKLPERNKEVPRVRSETLLNFPQKSHLPVAESEKEEPVSRKISKPTGKKTIKVRSSIRSPSKKKLPLKLKSPVKVKRKEGIRQTSKSPIEETAKEVLELKSKSQYEEKETKAMKLQSKLSTKEKREQVAESKCKLTVEQKGRDTSKLRSESLIGDKEKEEETTIKFKYKSPIDEKERKTVEHKSKSTFEKEEEHVAEEVQQQEKHVKETVELQSNKSVEQKENEEQDDVLQNKTLSNEKNVSIIDEPICKDLSLMQEKEDINKNQSTHKAKPTIQRTQLDVNEFYVEIVYPDEGDKVTGFTYDDISNFSMSVDVDDSDGEPQIVVCRTSGFQELFSDIPKLKISTENKNESLECSRSKSKAPSEEKNETVDSSRIIPDICIKKKNEILECNRSEKETSKSSKQSKDRRSHSSHVVESDYRKREIRKFSPSLERRIHNSRKYSSAFSRRRSPSPPSKRHTFSTHSSRRSQSVESLRSDQSPYHRRRSPSPLRPIRRRESGTGKTIKHKSPLELLYKDSLRSSGRFRRKERVHAVRMTEMPASKRMGREREQHHESHHSNKDYSRDSSHTSSTSHEITKFGVDDGSSKTYSHSEKRHHRNSHSSDMNKLKDVPLLKPSRSATSSRIPDEMSNSSNLSKSREKSHSKIPESTKNCESSNPKKGSDPTNKEVENVISSKSYEEKKRLNEPSHSVDVSSLKNPPSSNENSENVMEYKKSEKYKRFDESLEEGELDDDDSLLEPNVSLGSSGNSSDEQSTTQKCSKPVPSEDDLMTYALVGSERVENSGEEIPSYVRDYMRLESSEDISRLPETSAEDKTPFEPEKPKDVTVQKEGSFASADGSRILPPKKRKASSEDMTLKAEKKIRVDDPQFLLNQINVDRVLDYIHGEKPG